MHGHAPVELGQGLGDVDGAGSAQERNGPAPLLNTTKDANAKKTAMPALAPVDRPRVAAVDESDAYKARPTIDASLMVPSSCIALAQAR